MPKAPTYTKPKRSGENLFLSTGICVGCAVGGFLFFSSFMRHFNFYLDGTIITAQTSGAPHMVDRTFGARREIDYSFQIKGLTYHGSAPADSAIDDNGQLNVYYDKKNPDVSDVNYQEAVLVIIAFGAMIFIGCTSGIGALILARRRD